MYRLITLAAIASIALATPVMAQGRYGAEAAERKADREYREAVRRAEHPELYEKEAAKPAAAAPAQEAAASSQPATEPTAAAPAQAH
jgi:hypothetical protein